ncbi:MAG: threonine/serine dehydratase [Proteobacteria bacterium]|jgi:threonine dehydratase|nr:threonine/serine dehydratase [Pseudomonadota bacterium]
MNIEMIEAARQRLMGHARITPLLSSPFLDEIAGRKVFVKAEVLQHTGSFKFRGAWSALSALDKDTLKKGVIAYSSGNHAQGVAFAARKHKTSAVIVMPRDAPKTKIENTRALGGEVILYDRANNESREIIGQKIAKERGLTLIKPYDEPQVIAGQGTVGLEVIEQAQDLNVDAKNLLVCCGGGGLTSGIALAAAAYSSKLSVRTVEPMGYDDVARSLAANKICSNDNSVDSICDAIVTPQPGDLTFPIMNKYCGPGLVVTDEECLRAMALAFSRLKLIIEPGGAVALAAALFHAGDIEGNDVIVVASGGNVDAATFHSALSRFG